eukprot:TRINITY_DN6305_c0_g1_i1.p1 TRINITY_DN6305_c0_g1~~TRINITY_DN6305_c0_g1_i1.p1  ORF type:complete len:98 (+),score=20.68 TRINITY_DN6305_c0_g1_i1:88-381(+)
MLMLFGVLYQGIVELAEKLSNPLGADDVDLPEAAYHNFIHQECEAFFDASKNRYWMTEEDIANETRKHERLKAKALLKEMGHDDPDEDMDMPDMIDG